MNTQQRISQIHLLMLLANHTLPQLVFQLRITLTFLLQIVQGSRWSKVIQHLVVYFKSNVMFTFFVPNCRKDLNKIGNGWNLNICRISNPL